jgi:hypothetical protein
MRALVMGDGIAGLGAAIVLARAGWQVAVASARRGKPASHRTHAHLTSAAVLCQLERALGGAFEGWARGAAMVWDENGRRDAADRPILAAEALRQSLAARAAAAGVGFHADGTVTARPNGASWLWGSGDRDRDADLVVDATGSGHWLGRMEEITVSIDELAGTDRCWSWVGLNDGPAEPWLLAMRGRAQPALLLRGPDGQIRLTLRQPGPAAPEPLAVLDQLLLGAGAAWAARIGTITLDPRPLRHDSPLARRTLVSACTPIPALVRLGDGLIQTAPRLGQGIAQIAEQLDGLAGALAAHMPISQWQTQLDALADRRWAGLMLGAGLGRIAA